MKPAFAQFAPTVPLTFAAAMGIALSLFLLPGAGVSSEPTPLLAVLGGAAGRVAADLPAPVVHHASKPVRSAASPARPAVARPAQLVPRRQQAGAGTHRSHYRARAVRLPRSAAVPVQAAAPAAPATPVTTLRSFSNRKSKKSTSRGHAYGHSRALQPAAVAPAPRVNGHGKAKALGHSSEHHGGLPPGQAKKAPTVPPPAPKAVPKSNGNGNEKNGGKK